MKKVLFLMLLALAGSFYSQAQTDSTLKEYAGRYVFPAGSPTPDVTVTLDGGTLSLVSTLGSATLSKVEADVFAIVEYNGTATFRRNEQGKVNAIHVVVAGLDLVGTKESVGLYWWRPNLLFKH